MIWRLWGCSTQTEPHVPHTHHTSSGARWLARELCITAAFFAQRAKSDSAHTVLHYHGMVMYPCSLATRR